MLSNNQDYQSTMATLAAMCRQEEQGYQTGDFLNQGQQYPQQSSSVQTPLHSVAVMDIDVECRTKMVEWCHRVVDFCKFSRETAAIAMNILDRYMMNPHYSAAAKADRKVYQLAAMTSLYTAVKIHEAEAMDPALVSNISRGTYTPTEIEQMEVQLLQAVQWRVNPPTALAFVRQCLSLIPSSVLDEASREMVYEMCKQQTERAVAEYSFLTIKPSTIAYCAIMNALMGIDVHDNMTMHTIWAALTEALQLNPLEDGNGLLVVDIQAWLCESIAPQDPIQCLVMQQEQHRQETVNATPEKSAARYNFENSSPTTVSVSMG